MARISYGAWVVYIQVLEVLSGLAETVRSDFDKCAVLFRMASEVGHVYASQFSETAWFLHFDPIWMVPRYPSVFP